MNSVYRTRRKIYVVTVYAKNIHETDKFSIGLFFFKRAIILFFGQQKSGCTVERLCTTPFLYSVNITFYKKKHLPKYPPKFLGLKLQFYFLKNVLKHRKNFKCDLFKYHWTMSIEVKM